MFGVRSSESNFHPSLTLFFFASFIFSPSTVWVGIYKKLNGKWLKDTIAGVKGCKRTKKSIIVKRKKAVAKRCRRKQRDAVYASHRVIIPNANYTKLLHIFTSIHLTCMLPLTNWINNNIKQSSILIKHSQMDIKQ